MKKNKKVGLALGSGGFKGFAHVGVIRALVKNNIPIDYLAGSSIGAWVAAHYALYKDIDKLEEYTVEKRKEKMRCLFDLSVRGGFIKGSKVQELLSEWFHNANFNDTKIPVRIVATDLIAGAPVVFSKGKLSKAAQASMAVPTLFKPISYQDRILADGGISNPVPDDVVKKMGADIVLSVNLDHFPKNKKFDLKDVHLRKVTSRSFEIMRYYLSEYSMKDSDVIIQPNLEFIQGLWLSSWKKYFIDKYGSQIVEMGEKATQKQMKKIKKLLLK